jgi:hypothetical protein
MRMITSSIQPPKYPAAMPSGTPTTAASSSTTAAIRSDVRAP